MNTITRYFKRQIKKAELSSFTDSGSYNAVPGNKKFGQELCNPDTTVFKQTMLAFQASRKPVPLVFPVGPVFSSSGCPSMWQPAVGGIKQEIEAANEDDDDDDDIVILEYVRNGERIVLPKVEPCSSTASQLWENGEINKSQEGGQQVEDDDDIVVLDSNNEVPLHPSAEVKPIRIWGKEQYNTHTAANVITGNRANPLSHNSTRPSVSRFRPRILRRPVRRKHIGTSVWRSSSPEEPLRTPFTCHTCLKLCSSKCELIRHVFVHIAGVQPPSDICEQCGEVFSSDEQLVDHFGKSGGQCYAITQKAQDLNKEQQSSNSCNGISGSEEHPQEHSTESGKQSCNGTNTDAGTHEFEENSHIHSSGHTDVRAEGNGTQSSEETNTNASKCGTQSVEHNSRDVEGKTNSLPRQKRSHKKQRGRARRKRQKVVKPPEKIRCPFNCGSVFSTPSAVKRHVTIHTGQRQYKCEECGKAFPRADSLKAHSYKHTGRYPYVCHICGKPFSWSCNLKLHIRTHTKERPYLCRVCGKSFSRPWDLTLHTRKHTEQKTPPVEMFVGDLSIGITPA